MLQSSQEFRQKHPLNHQLKQRFLEEFFETGFGWSTRVHDSIDEYQPNVSNQTLVINRDCQNKSGNIFRNCLSIQSYFLRCCFPFTRNKSTQYRPNHLQLFMRLMHDNAFPKYAGCSLRLPIQNDQHNGRLVPRVHTDNPGILIFRTT